MSLTIFGVRYEIRGICFRIFKKDKKEENDDRVIKRIFYIYTFHVGDSFLGIVEKSVIIGFNEFGAWIVEE